jgi:hypothetical protein
MKMLTHTAAVAWTTIKSFMVLLCAVEYAMMTAIFNMLYDKLTIFNLPPHGLTYCISDSYSILTQFNTAWQMRYAGFVVPYAMQAMPP